VKTFEPETLDWKKMDGLIPAIVQGADTGAVLMLAYMNKKALKRTIRTGKVTFFSRSRKALWTKGETSGNYLILKEIQADCDGDTLLIQAEPSGPSCHRGTATCFSEDAHYNGLAFLNSLERLIHDRRREMPEGSYTTKLLARGLPQICKKLGEEAVEVVVSALQDKDQTRFETADLLYHLLVFLVEREVSLAEVMEELESRHGESIVDLTPGS
jgi:phosphoribosyl-ATP pyrophosphohydrolase/phosphoribosyl-AMP cyclohydrolase